MCIGGQQQDLILADGENIRETKSYQYLGVNISQDRTLDNASRDGSSLGRNVIALMNGILWDKKITEESKKQIYNTILRSIITYGSEVWSLKGKMKKKNIESNRNELLET
jgi:hypothetical protein